MSTREGDPRVVIVGCGRLKAARTCPAKDLYRSALFKAAARYAMTVADRWYIVSARHGLLEPDAVVEPYELSLSQLKRDDRRAWGLGVGAAILAAVPELDAEVEFLAGEAYSAAIDWVEERDVTWSEPLRGLGIGERISWLKREAARAMSAAPTEREV